MSFVMIYTYSMQLEVHMTSSTTNNVTLELMRKSFITLGLPEVSVSDNATNFTSEEFATFMRKNAIQHVNSPPTSNGLAERAVQTLKEGLRSWRVRWTLVCLDSCLIIESLVQELRQSKLYLGTNYSPR